MMLDHIELPDDLLWVDEFDWNPVAQDIDRSLTGALMVQEQAKLYGRPITLTGGDEAGWVTRATILELMALAKLPNKRMILTLIDGRSFSVIFNRDQLALAARPVFATVHPEGGDFYTLKVNLINLTLELV